MHFLFTFFFQEARKTLQELWNTSQIDLARLEKSIGVAVSKAQSYYDTRIKLRDSKDLLTKAKHRFERAQALHVAAKELALVSVSRSISYILSLEVRFRWIISMKRKVRVQMRHHGVRRIDMQ